MAVQIERSTEQTALVRFSLPESEHPESVSVVGTFNDWTPGAHPFSPHSDGQWSVTIEIPDGQEIRFRYLGEDDRWFDDPDAEVTGDDGGRITVSLPEAQSAAPEPSTADTVERDETIIDVDFDAVRAES